jgi:hypothetical protein
MKLRVLVLSALLAVTFSACSKERVAANNFTDFYQAQTGQKLSIEKLFTLVNGVTVFKNKSTGELVAFNTAKYDKNTMTTMAQYLAVANQPSDVVHNLSERSVTTSYEQYHAGYWYDVNDPVYDNYGHQTGYTTHSYYSEPYYTTEYTTTYYYDGGGFTFSENNAQNKDLDAIASNVETANNAVVTNSIVAQYGLSEDRAQSLADLAVNYAKLRDARRLTDADKEVFAKKALNVSFNDLQSAYKGSVQGNAGQYNTIINQAAEFNGLSPEKARTLIDSYFTTQQ